MEAQRRLATSPSTHSNQVKTLEFTQVFGSHAFPNTPVPPLEPQVQFKRVPVASPQTQM